MTFDFAEGLVEDNLLIVDRETRSLWSQLDARAISGPRKGEPLRVVPALQTSWGHWKSLHPETRVMTVEGEEGRPYYYRAWIPGTPRPERRPAGHDTRRLGLGLARGGEALFLPLSELARSEARDRPFEISLGGASLLIHYAPEVPTGWAESPAGELFPGVLAYDWGWLRFHPQSRTLRWDEERGSWSAVPLEATERSDLHRQVP